MATYIIRRLIQGSVVLFLSTFMIYSIILITPGGPQDIVNQIRLEAGSRPIDPGLIGRLNKQYGLDKPYPINYLAWLFDPTDTEEWNFTTYTTVTKGINIFGVIKGSGILTGDFSESTAIEAGTPTLTMMGQRIGNTLTLTILATVISIIVALPIGIVSAIKQYSRLDYTVTAFSFVGLAMPVFWLGLMLIIFTAVLPKDWHTRNGWDWLPYMPPGDNYDSQQEGNVVNRIYHLVLPVTVLSFVNIAGLSRYVRASMLEVLKQDYVRTAWAKGLSQRVVILRHALRNALIPVITIITLGLPGLFAGAIITETVFAYSGMGKLYYESILAFDIPLIMGFLLIITALIITSNILADVLYAVADPRIRFS